MAKRFQKEHEYTPQASTRRPTLPDETARDLLHVGARARKHVSEGHLTASASNYSFSREIEQQAPPPVMDSGEWQDLRPPSGLQHRMARKPLKRQLVDDDDDEDDATDVDEDMEMEKPQSINSIKAYYVPPNYKSMGDQPTNDFDDVTFLQNKEDL